MLWDELCRPAEVAHPRHQAMGNTSSTARPALLARCPLWDPVAPAGQPEQEQVVGCPAEGLECPAEADGTATALWDWSCNIASIPQTWTTLLTSYFLNPQGINVHLATYFESAHGPGYRYNFICRVQSRINHILTPGSSWPESEEITPAVLPGLLLCHSREGGREIGVLHIAQCGWVAPRGLCPDVRGDVHALLQADSTAVCGHFSPQTDTDSSRMC